MNYLYIALISMVPLIELRGAIPVSQIRITNYSILYCLYSC